VPPALLALEAPLRAALELGASLLRYRRGDTVFSQGSVAASVYCIRSGTLKVVRERPQGPRIVHLALPGEMLGMAAILTERRHSFSALALSPGEAHVLEAGLFRAALQASRPFCLALLRQLAQDLTLDREELAMRGDLPMHARLAHLLLDLHGRAPGGSAGPRSALGLTRYDLAEILGSAQETVSRSLGALEKAGLIAREGRLIRVLDAEALQALSASDRSNVVQTLEGLKNRSEEP
jgi:CRP/FNR family transcriptional regulator